jgi:2-polyprenyl-3-methyl-5-hydroxy-6-metoxy-1,4-benzoquinol methylase
VKQYWDRRPCNIWHFTQTVGTREYFDEVEARKLVEPHIPGFAESENGAGRKCWKLGVASAPITSTLQRHGARVTSVDLSEKSLELARQRARVYGVQDQVPFYRGNAEELTTFVPIELYDLIYSFGVIHHTPHPERVVQQLRQYARPGTTVRS